jgi:hypothetical protein
MEGCHGLLSVASCKESDISYCMNCCSKAARKEMKGLNERRSKYILALTSDTCKQGESNLCWLRLCKVNEVGLYC